MYDFTLHTFSSFTFSSHKIKAGLVFIFYDWILNVGIFIKKRVFIETMNKDKNYHARLEKEYQTRDDENRNRVGTGFAIKKLPLINRESSEFRTKCIDRLIE